jgi:trk system potassium uptake protein TrkA
MKRIGIIGAGRFGSELAEHLARRGAEVVLLERDRKTVQKMSEILGKVVQGDATDIQALQEAGFQECDAVVVAIGLNMEGSILATMNLKELNVPYIVAKADTDMHGRVLERIGANHVIYPDRERAVRLARSLLAGQEVDFFEIGEGVSVVEMKAPARFTGRTLTDCELRKKYGVTVLAIKHEATSSGGAAKCIISPMGEDLIEEGDSLVLFGPDRKLEALAQ